MIGRPSSEPRTQADSPANRLRRDPWLFLGPALVLLAVLWLWRSQLGGEVQHVGNHDRLLFGLTQELVNYDHREATGRNAQWDEIPFGGVNHGALPSVGENFSVLKLLMPWVAREDFYAVAGLMPLALMLLAAAAAYLALQAAVRPLAAATGSILYVCSVFAQLNFSQIDLVSVLLVSLPFGAWLVFFRPPGLTTCLLLVLSALPVAYLGFAPQSWYLIGFWILLSLHRAFLDRQWAPIQQLAGALFAAFVLCLPRLWTILAELQSYQRMAQEMGPAATFDQLQNFFNVTPRELLRWLDDGLFGRFPEEASAFNNNLNLNEGFQIYSSTFATLLGLLVVVRYRNRWFGALHPDSGWVASCAWTLIVVGLVTFVAPVTRVVHQLFLSAPLIHARISIIGILPAAALAAAGIDQWLREAPAESNRSWRTFLIAAATIGLLAAWSLNKISRTGEAATAVATNQSLANLAATAIDTVMRPVGRPVKPFGVVVRRSEPRTLQITWEANGQLGREFVIELRRGSGDFAEIGQTSGTSYQVGDTALDDRYSVRIRTILGTTQSDFSAEASVGPGEVSGPSPRATESPHYTLNGERLARMLACVLLFIALLVFMIIGRNSRSLLAPAGVTLAVLMIAQSLGDADLRANGPQTRSFPVPFKGDNLFNAPPDTLRPPTSAQRDELHERLEPDRWRTVFLPPAGFGGFSAPHVAVFWQLRTIEGYLSGVPERLRKLPWPEGAVGLRTLAFEDDDALPWGLLARLNVRQVVRIDEALYFNLPRTNELTVIPNPVPAVPREFFAARTAIPAPGSSPQSQIVIDPRVESWVEDPDAAGDWATDGTIEATYRGEVIGIKLTPSTHDRLLVLNESYHSGWSAATGTGTQIPIVPVNTFMRGIRVPAGVTEVRLTFETGPTAVARWSSAIAFLALMAGLVQISRKWSDRQTD